MEKLGSNLLVPHFLREKYVQNKHDWNKAKTKPTELKPLKTSSVEPIISKLVLWLRILKVFYFISNSVAKNWG